MRYKTRAQRWLAQLTALAVVAGLLGVALPAVAAEQTVTSAEVEYTFLVGEVGDFDLGDRLLLDVGHTDAVAPTLEDGELVIKTKDDTMLHDTAIVYRDPADLVFQVLPEAETTAPGFAPFEFLGPAGTPVWLLPMTQDPSLLWPGWSTEHSSLAGEFTSIQFEITDVEGPGDFHLFLNDAFGNPIHRANSVGTLSNTWTEPVPAHVHSNWAFTAAGVYTITFQVSGTWLNAPDDPDPVIPVLTIEGVEDHYHTGETATLTAVQDPQTDLDHYHWFIRVDGAAEFVIAPGDTGTDTYSFVVEEELDDAEIKVVLYDDDHNALAESEPVTIHIDDHDDPEPPADLSQTITVSLEADEGALVVSVDPDDR
ncbi:MAG: choice-of-anchor M domain-containing protein, partial [Acidimicrobiia bacterium]